MDNNLITSLSVCMPLTLGAFDGSLSLLYYSHISTIILSLVFGLFVLIRGEGKIVSKIFFALTMLFITWSILDLFTWLSSDTRVIMFTWSLTGIIEALFFVMSFYFIYVFATKEDISLRYKILAGIVMAPLIFMIPTKLNLSAFDIDECYSIENNISLYYKYAVEILFSIAIIVFSLIKIKQVDGYVRRQLSLLFVGVILFLLSFFSAIFLSGYLVDNGWNMGGYKFELYGLFGTTIFMGFLAYIIVKFKTFDIKILGAQALIVAQIILIAAMFTFASSTTNRILISITLLITAVMGWFLIRSTKKLDERKEELQLMAGKLAQANDQLRVLDNAKTEFISIASHQLRTPLTAVKGFVSMLLEGSYGELKKEQEDVLNKVYTSNERLVTLVEDLLNVSRMESGRMEFAFGKWDMTKICKDVYDTFVLRAKEHDLYLECSVPEQELPEVTIDGVKVREVVSNLVDNAIKYTLEGHGGVRMKLEQLGENIRVTISDTGIGIPQTELPYLFAKFSRGKDVGRLNTGGTGLGLYVGKSMIENNGGRIWAESDGQDKGSRFIIEIPVHQSEELLKKWA